MVVVGDMSGIVTDRWDTALALGAVAIVAVVVEHALGAVDGLVGVVSIGRDCDDAGDVLVGESAGESERRNDDDIRSTATTVDGEGVFGESERKGIGA